MDELPVANIFKHLLVLGITSLPPFLDAKQLLNIIDSMSCPLQSSTDEL